MNSIDKTIIDNGGTRSGKDRRQDSTKGYYPERRSGQDRRSGLDRRDGLGRRKDIDRRDCFRGKI